VLNYLKADKYKPSVFEYLVVAKWNWGLATQIFICDCKIKSIEKCFRQSEMRCVLVKKLVREVHFIVPIENAIITEI